jgi:diketogulonate reductase-like aldo/keto reductase
MKTVAFKSGEQVPALGQGTWHFGEGKNDRSEEVAALRTGLDLGMALIDTAEMYGDGAAEEVVGEAIKGRRAQVFLVSKVYPHHASRGEMPKACARSLKRLQIETLDLYLLHWRGTIPLRETVDAFEDLLAAGKILRWGVSNFDVDDMEDLGASANDCATDQVLYNPEARGIEFDLLPWCQKHEMPLMAYSPIGQGGRLLKNKAILEVAKRHEATPAQIALAWVLRQTGVIAIPKAGDVEHVRENAAAADIALTAEDLATIDAAFPPPTKKEGLRVI